MRTTIALIATIAAACAVPAAAQVRYTDVTATSGIDFVHARGDRPVPPLLPGQNERFGVGAAVADYDNDGYHDVYLPNSLGHPNRLFRNRGDGTFEDVTDAAGVGHLGFSKQALWVDLDNDGFKDLVVCNDTTALEDGFPTGRIYKNLGDGTFEDVTDASGFAPADATHGGLAAGDIDNDGDVDLFVAGWFEATRRLYRNEHAQGASFTFTDATDAAGGFPADDRFHWQPMIVDLDSDGLADIYAAVDFFEDYALRNNGDGTFTDTSHDWGLTHVANDMGVAYGDVDGDGDLDLYTTNMSADPTGPTDEPGPNMLYVNDGAGVFTPGAVAAGVDQTYFAWGTWLFDADLDADLDLLAVNGWEQPQWHTRARFFLNRGDGRFDDAGPGSGLDHRGNTRGLTPIDLENDGDVDFIMTDVLAPAVVLRNDTPRDGAAWLRVLPRGTVSNRDGIGAVVTVTAAGTTQTRHVLAGGSFYAAPPIEAHYGLGEAGVASEVRVRFPSGRTAVLRDVALNRTLVVDEP